MHSILIYIAFLVLVYMVLLFIMSLLNKRNDIADVGWGLGFIVVAFSALKFDVYFRGDVDVRSLVLVGLVTMWGLRLFVHIYRRYRSRGEDPRYVAMKAHWGKMATLYSFLEVFLLQGFLLFIIALPVMYGITTHGVLFPTWFDIMGIALWTIGFLFETVGDAELGKFLKNPANKGHLMTSGLWSITRHPNYFGEVVVWWGIWLVAMAGHAPWWTIAGPLMITYLITHVSGIPMTEARQASHPEFADYKARVSRFIPLYPGKKLFGSWKEVKRQAQAEKH